MAEKGKFIVIEGIDGTGKTSLTNYILDVLTKKDIKAIQTREPGGTEFGNTIRKIVLESEPGQISPLSQVLLFSAARELHLKQVIAPALQAGVWVICDRFIDSTVAYQTAQDETLYSIIYELEDRIVTHYPDFTLYLDVENVEVALKRAKARNFKSDFFETQSLEYFTKVRDTFRQNFREWYGEDELIFKVINAELGQEEVQKLAIESIESIINKFKEQL